MDGDRPNQEDLPEGFNIEEVSNASDEASDALYAGTVEAWKILEFAEKAKVRPFITGIVLSAWAFSILASAFRLMITGNYLFIIPPALISVPLYIVLKFYFRSG